MNKKRYLAITFVLSLVLLSNITLFSYPVRADNNVRMLNGIGIHEIDLSEPGNLESNGFIEIENKQNYSVDIIISTSNNIFSLDLGPNNEPRIHDLGLKGDKANVTFEPLPDTSWIKFEKMEYTLEPYTILEINYKLDFSREDLNQYNENNLSRGFLGYIFIKNAGGSQININYRYKMFIVFEETINTALIIPSWIQHIFIIGLIVTITSIIIVKKVELVDIETERNVKQ